VPGQPVAGRHRRGRSRLGPVMTVLLDRPPAPFPGKADRDTLAGELRHWRQAVIALGDLDAVASPAAWAGLESYLGERVRGSLTVTTPRLGRQAEQGAAPRAAAATGGELRPVRAALLRLRRRYLQVETVVGFFGEAIGARSNPRLAAALRGLDALAV